MPTYFYRRYKKHNNGYLWALRLEDSYFFLFLLFIYLFFFCLFRAVPTVPRLGVESEL